MQLLQQKINHQRYIFVIKLAAPLKNTIQCYRLISGMLERHFRCHFNRTLCLICNRVFKSNNDMKIHLAGHDGAPEFEKKFICHICGKRFSRNADLLKHVKVHTNERPFACPHCEKAFKRKDKLKLHLDLHLGYKPHICNYCHKKFSQKTHLNEHIRKHVSWTRTLFLIEKY